MATASTRRALSHVALLYDNDDELLEAAVPFLADGVASGAPTLLSVRDRERSLILDGLGATTGVTVVPPWPPGAAFRTLRQNQQLINGRGAAGDSKIRILGEVPCTTETVPWGGWVRYETAINYVYSQLPVSMLCPYDRRLTPSSVLDDVNRTHPFLAAATDGPISNAGFVDPAAFLGDLAHRDLDPIEAEQPTLELVDQLPGTSRRSVSALAESTDLDRPSIEALALAVGEVVTNAVDPRPATRGIACLGSGGSGGWWCRCSTTGADRRTHSSAWFPSTRHRPVVSGFTSSTRPARWSRCPGASPTSPST